MEKLIAYCLKTRQKEEMHNVTITKNAKGGYIATGESKDGYKMSLIMSEKNALIAVEKGLAVQGW